MSPHKVKPPPNETKSFSSVGSSGGVLTYLVVLISGFFFAIKIIKSNPLKFLGFMLSKKERNIHDSWRYQWS